MSASDFTVPPNASLEEKVDLILFFLAGMAKKQEQVDALVVQVNTLEAKLASQEIIINTLSKESRTAKEAINNREQADRGNTLRLFGLPLTTDEQDGNKTISSIVYDRVLKPILIAAKNKGLATSVPQLSNLITDCYRVGKPSSSSGGSGASGAAAATPPPIIIKFGNPQHRLAILKNKKASTPPPTEAERFAGSKRFVLVEDLTSANHRMLKDLQNDERVSKVWSVDGRIRFVLSGQDESIKRVKSVFDTPDSVIQSAMKSK